MNQKQFLLPVLYKVGTKAWAALYLPLQAFLISKMFTPGIQGYFFTFQSLIGLHIFAELGLYFLLVSFAAHDSHLLSFGKRGKMEGDPQGLKRLHALGHFAFRWYMRGGGCLFFILLGIGVLLLKSPDISPSFWLIPWVLTSGGIVLQLLTIPALSLLEGVNQLTFVAKIQLRQSLLIGLISIVSIYVGFQLWSIPLALIISSLWMFWSLFRSCKDFFRPFFSPPEHSLIWKEEIFPMQWRLALSCIADFCSFSLFTPLYFLYFGSILSGKVGMTLLLVSILPKGVYIWTHTYTPQISSYIAQRKQNELSELMKRLFLIVFLTVIMLFILTYVFFGFVHQRALPSSQFLCFLTGNVFLALGMPFVVFLRAHKKEPLFPFSLSLSGLTISTMFLGALLQKPAIIPIGYMGIQFLYLITILVLWKRQQEITFQKT